MVTSEQSQAVLDDLTYTTETPFAEDTLKHQFPWGPVKKVTQ